MTTEIPSPGWYADPRGGNGQTYWDGAQWRNDVSSSERPAAAIGTYASQQPSAYKYKNPVLYAFGGFVIPPLVLFLMGGDRKTCLWILSLWGVYWFMWLMIFVIGFVAVLFCVAAVLGALAWSVIACYQEAIKQNTANGLV